MKKLLRGLFLFEENHRFTAFYPSDDLGDTSSDSMTREIIYIFAECKNTSGLVFYRAEGDNAMMEKVNDRNFFEEAASKYELTTHTLYPNKLIRALFRKNKFNNNLENFWPESYVQDDIKPVIDFFENFDHYCKKMVYEFEEVAESQRGVTGFTDSARERFEILSVESVHVERVDTNLLFS